jgi:hypothetical protein
MNAHAPIARGARACGLLLTVALAVPALAAGAPTVNTDLPCYTPGQPIGLSGAGYTPKAPCARDIGFVWRDPARAPVPAPAAPQALAAPGTDSPPPDDPADVGSAEAHEA